MISCSSNFKGAIRPYAVAMAGFIEKALRSCDEEGSGVHLNYYWEVAAKFDESSDLKYTLTIPGINSRHPIKATRAKVDRDIQIIIGLLSKAYEQLNNHIPSNDYLFEKLSHD